MLAAHAAHVRFTEAVGVLLTKVPAAQIVHTAQVAAFAVAVKAPLEQPAQVRFAVALPADEMYSPATHVVWAAHAVAELAS